MQSRIISVDDHTAWAVAMNGAGARDVYYSPHYHKLYSFRGGRCLAYIATGGGETLFYPYFIRPIGRVGSVDISPQLNDIETVYGYTGPMATTDSGDFLAEAWAEFASWCSEHNVVSEFVRSNPFLRTERFVAPQTKLTLDRKVVEICLDGAEDDLWRSYDPVQRNRVRKALRSDVTCQQADLKNDLSVFRRLYEATMHRIGAAEFYMFPESYYHIMMSSLSKHAVLFFARLADQVIAASLFLHYGNNIHYHLGGSCQKHLSLAPNNLLFHEVSAWARRHGFRRLHLGGGKSNAADDPLFRFKRRFSQSMRPFYLGRRVHDRVQYDRLCELWRQQARYAALPSHFPPYRVGPSSVSHTPAQARPFDSAIAS